MSHTNTNETKKIPLGSGEIYCVKYVDAIPAEEIFESETNRLGHITGGASLEYTPSYYNAKDDLNQVNKSILTDEDVKLKCGLITWNADTLKKMIPNAEVTESGGKRTLKFGGIKNQKIEKYLFRFVNKDAADGDIRITVAGNFQGAITLNFQKDKEASINPEIFCVPMSDGRIVRYEEEILDSSEGDD